ncbi:MAG: DUF4168 domain-containing protein [Burkholderiaceae bacterium]|nr:DUF4168 domain-containing protein [Burkholderiaceae bacterium]
MNPLPKAFLSASILAMGLATAPVMAQTATPQTPTRTHSAAPDIQPNDAQLKNFAQASQKVAMVAEEYQPKLHASPDDSTRQQVMQEADEKMIQLVSAEGLTVDEYNGISVAVQQDPKLRQRVIDLVNKPGG